MLESTRFVCPSACLTLKSLLKRTRNGLWIGAGCALAIHLSLTQIGSSDGEQKAAKPLTTHFVKRQPRLSKPLELKKRPKPKHRRIQRKMVSVKAKLQRDQRGGHFHPIQVLRGLATPSVEIGRIAGFGTIEMDPRSISDIVEGTKEVEQKV